MIICPLIKKIDIYCRLSKISGLFTNGSEGIVTINSSNTGTERLVMCGTTQYRLWANNRS